jgi:hypothetical protein
MDRNDPERMKPLSELGEPTGRAFPVTQTTVATLWVDGWVLPPVKGLR